MTCTHEQVTHTLHPYPQATKPSRDVSHKQFLNEVLCAGLQVPRPIYLPLKDLLIDAKWMLVKEWRITMRVGWEERRRGEGRERREGEGRERREGEGREGGRGRKEVEGT